MTKGIVASSSLQGMGKQLKFPGSVSTENPVKVGFCTLQNECNTCFPEFVFTILVRVKHKHNANCQKNTGMKSAIYSGSNLSKSFKSKKLCHCWHFVGFSVDLEQKCQIPPFQHPGKLKT